MICDRCGKEIVSDGFATGYGVTPGGKKYCYQCCAEIDSDALAAMQPGGKYCLYFKEGDTHLPEVVNWPGTLRIKCYGYKTGRHNIAGTRRDVWFKHRGKNFHGVQYGDFSEICHIQAVKEVK